MIFLRYFYWEKRKTKNHTDILLKDKPLFTHIDQNGDADIDSTLDSGAEKDAGAPLRLRCLRLFNAAKLRHLFRLHFARVSGHAKKQFYISKSGLKIF